MLGNGNKDSYADVVFDSTFDIFILSGSTDSSFISSAKPVVTRLKECMFKQNFIKLRMNFWIVLSR